MKRCYARNALVATELTKKSHVLAVLMVFIMLKRSSHQAMIGMPDDRNRFARRSNFPDFHNHWVRRALYAIGHNYISVVKNGLRIRISFKKCNQRILCCRIKGRYLLWR